MTRTAKELFWYYCCNHFFLDRDGALDEYKRLGGDPENEKAWRDEFIALWISRIDNEDLLALRHLMNANAHEAIPALLALEDYGDDYAKFWFAYTLSDLAQLKGADRRKAKLAKKKATDLWREILAEPVGITFDHKQEVDSGMKEALKARTAEEYVRNYATRKLKNK